MKSLFVIKITIILAFVVSSCAIHKEPPKPSETPSEDSYYQYFLHGAEFLNQRDYGKAIEQLKIAISLNPNFSKAFNLLGIAHFQLKEYKQAEVQFKKAIERDPSYAQAYSNLGGVFIMNQNFDKAIEMLQKAISLSPDNVSAYYSLGYLLFAQGKIDEGSLYFSKGVSIDPEYLEKKKDFIAQFSLPSYSISEIYFTLAKVFASQGNIEKAVEYLEKAEHEGFREWYRIEKEKEFENVREDPRIKAFMKSE